MDKHNLGFLLQSVKKKELKAAQITLMNDRSRFYLHVTVCLVEPLALNEYIILAFVIMYITDIAEINTSGSGMNA